MYTSLSLWRGEGEDYSSRRWVRCQLTSDEFKAVLSSISCLCLLELEVDDRYLDVGSVILGEGERGIFTLFTTTGGPRGPLGASRDSDPE